jgi:predicted NUDIX family NTP pyrophosphohydrolase
VEIGLLNLNIMPKKSAGILFYRFHDRSMEVLLVHPGGPFWSRKDEGAWSIPKGEFDENENPLDAAKREVKEELGLEIDGHFIELPPARQRSSKIIYCWALEKDIDVSIIQSNTFEIEWPPKSGMKREFPEIDQAAWFDKASAMKKIIPGQAVFIDLLEKMLT